MKKTVAMYLTAAMVISISAGAFAQDAPGGMMVSVPGLNLQVGAKVKDDLLAGTEKFAQGASQVTEINLDPSVMGMIGPQYGPDAKLAGKMKLMVVHNYQYDKPGTYRMEDVEAFAKKLQDGSWSCPVIAREKDKMTYICAKTDSDHETNEMVILAAEPQKLSFIHMAGTMSLNDLSHMSGSAKSVEKGVEHSGPERRLTMPAPAPYFVPRPIIVPPTPPAPAEPPAAAH